MGSDGADKLPRSEVGEGSETTIEIKIKTLDSQTYTLRVDKQMPVPALKEQIASVTGMLSEQQRLICRGKVLKDDQLLSAYHVEDGHMLHLVVRQPNPPSAEGLNHPATDPASSTSRSHGGRPSVVIETFSLPDQGDSMPPEISRLSLLSLVRLDSQISEVLVKELKLLGSVAFSEHQLLVKQLMQHSCNLKKLPATATQLMQHIWHVLCILAFIILQ